jgi:enoyl-CoA hydratase/carnithine racemase
MVDGILIERDGDIARITINEPENGNRMSNPMAQELTDAVDASAKDSRLILLAGAAKDFCLGRAQIGERRQIPEAYVIRQNSEVIFNVYGAFRRSRVLHATVNSYSGMHENKD